MTTETPPAVIAEHALSYLGHRVLLTRVTGMHATRLEGRLIGWTKRIKDDDIYSRYSTLTEEITLEVEGGYTLTVPRNYSVRIIPHES